MKRAVLYARVSTDEQAEHGYSLESQIEAGQKYAIANELTIVEEISDGYSGAKLARPGLDRVRGITDSGQADAVIVFAPDRLTRNLAHSLLLREEWQKAGIELHYCNRGKSSGTPESQMAENIEAVFSDYWRAKIIEGSRRGRRQKAANGRWPCDGHACYGYEKIGKARDAHLQIDENEAQIVRRIFELYIGAQGKPLPLQTIAATLTSEGIPTPGRGIGKKKKAKGWYRNTVRTILTRRAYIGEFSYGGIEISLPDLAIIDLHTFEAANRRREKSRARAIHKRKYDFLLAGHICCSCGTGMSADAMQKGRYRYYACNTETNGAHIRSCEEKRIRAQDAEEITWNWVISLLCDEEQLENGLKRMEGFRESDLEPLYEQLKSIETLLKSAENRIERLANEYAVSNDDAIASALKNQLRNVGRERQALISEKEKVMSEIASHELSSADYQAIKEAAVEIRRKLVDPTFEQKRALYDMLDIQVELEWKNNQRGISVTCGLKLSPEGKRIPTWMNLSSLGGKSSSTTTILRLTTSS